MEAFEHHLGDQGLLAYVKLEPNLNLATATLIALAEQMLDEDWAKFQLQRVGIPTSRPVKEKTSEVGGSVGLTAKMSEKDLPSTEPQFPIVSFEALLKIAKEKKKKKKVIISVEGLDRMDFDDARKQLLEAQGLFKADACFICAGNSSDIANDPEIRKWALFDLDIELESLDMNTSYEMLTRYLSRVRYQPNSSNNIDAAVYPFTKTTALELCRASRGIPRWLHHIGNCVLREAVEQQASEVNTDVLKIGLERARSGLQ